MSFVDQPDRVRTDEEVIVLLEDQRNLLISVANRDFDHRRT